MILILWSIQGYSLEVGDVAPNFSLPGTDGQTHHLSDYLGNSMVVLAWFPKAYTRACTLECRSLASNGQLLKRFAVHYFMVSVDPIETNIGFAQQQQADFPLLSDRSGQAARAYNVLDKRNQAVRHTFYIGGDGKILAIDRNIRPETAAEDMAEMLKKLQVSTWVD